MNLKQLADRLKLSQTTVSRALNGYPEVNEETRKRVLDAARAFNYRPNSRARSLATGRSMAIGHVVPLSAQVDMLNVVFSDFIVGAGEIYAQHGFDMMVSVVPDAQELQTYKDAAQRGSVDGFILHGPTRNDQRLGLLTDLGVPFVVHGRSTGHDTPYSWVDVDNRRAIKRATSYLLDLGHRRIGFLNGPEHMDFALRRREGYISALAQHGQEPDEALMRAGRMLEPYGHDAAAEMLDLPNPPSAFVCSSLVSTLGIRRAMDRRGLQMGRDISLVCFDDELAPLPNDGVEGPIFTAARSSVRLAGRRCAEILIDRINDPNRPETQELWEADLVIGESTGVRPKVTI